MSRIIVKAIRTHCCTNEEQEVKVSIEREYIERNLNSWWIKIVEGGVTGHESMRFDLIPKCGCFERGWVACMKTPNSWDGLYIPPEEMKKIYDYFSGNLDKDVLKEMLEDSIDTPIPTPYPVSIEDKLTIALEQSLKLQSHYANLLNMYDGGERLTFPGIQEWFDRLEEIGGFSNEDG